MKSILRFIGIPSTEYDCNLIHDKKQDKCLSTGELLTILNKQDYIITELLYKLKDYGKNINDCGDCECYIPTIKYCWMYDMNVYPYDIVTECEEYKKTKVSEKEER